MARRCAPDAVRPTLKPTTAEGYRQKLAHVDRVLGERELSSVDAGDIRDLHSALFNRDLSAHSVRHVHKVWSRALRDAEKWELISSNPVAKVDPPRVEHREQESWSVDEVRSFFEAATDDRLLGLWVLMVTTGLRRSEALGLKWGDVDLDAGRVAVRRAVTTAGHEVHIGELKTSSSRRAVAIDEGTVAELRAHRAR